MKSEILYTLIHAPVLSEKSMRLAEQANQYVFKVDPKSTKLQIKSAIEKMFDVKVSAIGTVNIKGKVKRTKNRIGKRSDFKKAYVTLAEGQTINITEMQ
ncbi:MAG: 50S ribosomal protein L23 [Gammaproteobacteria bacterium]|jgi:large subunit ribosomal protein L23